MLQILNSSDGPSHSRPPNLGLQKLSLLTYVFLVNLNTISLIDFCRLGESLTVKVRLTNEPHQREDMRFIRSDSDREMPELSGDMNQSMNQE